MTKIALIFKMLYHLIRIVYFLIAIACKKAWIVLKWPFYLWGVFCVCAGLGGWMVIPIIEIWKKPDYDWSMAVIITLVWTAPIWFGIPASLGIGVLTMKMGRGLRATIKDFIDKG